jgi:GNAT superfamily N-acetyltransferase
MPEQLRIRDASVHERATIQELTRRAYGEYASVMEPDAWRELENAVLAAFEGPNNAHHIVVDRDGELVASVLLYPPGVIAYSVGDAMAGVWPEVRLLAVPAEERGKGFARALMAECVSRARALGAEHLGLHTSHSMRAAIGLYKSLGFERAPALDFRTERSELIEGYRLKIRP